MDLQQIIKKHLEEYQQTLPFYQSIEEKAKEVPPEQRKNYQDFMDYFTKKDAYVAEKIAGPLVTLLKKVPEQRENYWSLMNSFTEKDPYVTREIAGLLVKYFQTYTPDSVKKFAEMGLEILNQYGRDAALSFLKRETTTSREVLVWKVEAKGPDFD